MTGYKDVFINTITTSEVFADTCGEARYLTMELLTWQQENGKPMEKDEILEFFSKTFDILWQKRIEMGRGN